MPLDGLRPGDLIRGASVAASKLRGRASGALTARLPAVSLENIVGASVLQSHCLDDVAPLWTPAAAEAPAARRTKVEMTMGMLWYVLAVLMTVYMLRWVGL